METKYLKKIDGGIQESINVDTFIGEINYCINSVTLDIRVILMSISQCIFLHTAWSACFSGE